MKQPDTEDHPPLTEAQTDAVQAILDRAYENNPAYRAATDAQAERQAREQAA